MRDGHILQVDTPQTLYEQPMGLFVAGFIGSPAMNLVEARIEGEEVSSASFGSARRGTTAGHERRRHPRHSAGDVRGRRVRIARTAGDRHRGCVLEELGSDAHVFFRVDASRVGAGLDENADEATDLVTDRRGASQCACRSPDDSRVGDPIRLALDPSRFHFFDAETGASLLVRGPALRDEPAATAAP